MSKFTQSSRKLSALLMVGASGLALATPAQANEFLYTTQQVPLKTGERVTQTETLTQIRLAQGGTASFTDNAQYQINEDGSVELYQGTVTIASSDGKRIVLRMPDGLEAQVFGRGAAANFSVQPDGDVTGHALTGETRIGRQGRLRAFSPGDLWAAKPGDRPRRVIANTAQTAPQATSQTATSAPQVAAIGGDAGPVGAATNGIPVTLGDALAAAGASSDILGAARRVERSVANPVLDTFPSGDLALLIDRAAQIEFAFGGSPFPQAEADIIRAYLRFLAAGGGGAQFLSTFSAFSLDYLDLIRAGGVPGSFAAAGVADINAYLAFIDRTGALTQLAASNRLLAEAYLGFLRDGGNPDRFAASFTDLTNAYFAFVRAGNAPGDFEGASQAVLTQTIVFLADSGLVQQLGAADQALVAAFLRNGGLAFTGQFQMALDDYFAFLASGNRPSAYEPVDQATLRQFLETLSDTGLLATVLGDQAQFYADYLAFLRSGGGVDAFAGLPVNIFTDYAAQLDAYRAFLNQGNRPSAFDGADPAQLQVFIAQLQAAGALDRFLGQDAAFFAAFADFVNNGGAFDAFDGLNANIFAGYATDLQAYFAFLEAGGIPSAYKPLSQAVIAQYLAELQAAGATGRFLPDLGEFYAAYFAFVSGGGNPDNFAQLPVPPDFGAFAAALGAYADFLASGGLPADFEGTDLSVLATFITALRDAGQLDARLGANAGLLEAYFAFLAGGGAPNAFAGLPIYADYVADLNAYFAFLADGGLPQDYAELDQATINAFLAALRDVQGGLAGFGNLNAFFTDYAAFVLGGGDPAQFAGLPVYAQYIADLNAYFAFLAAGGVPSEYTVLSQDVLNAYLEALANAQGGLAGFAGLNQFFIDFFAFLQGGGVADNFAPLPINADTPLNALGDINGWQFARDGLRVARTDAEIDDDGRITSLTVFNPNGVTTDYSGRDADLREFGRIGNDVAWTRYFVGAANNQTNVSEHLLVGTPATNIPASGVVQYSLVGGTVPTNRNDIAGSTAFFDGALGVAFGTVPLVGVDFEVLTRTAGYRVSTPGGAANPMNGGMGVDGNGRFENQNLPITPLFDANCTNFCQAQVFGGLFGDGATSAGFTYNVFDQGNNTSVQGVAIFGTEGEAIDGLGTRPDTGGGATGGGGSVSIPVNPQLAYTGGFDAADAKISFIASFNTFGGSETSFGAQDYVLNADGGLIAYTREGSSIRRELGSASLSDISGNADILIGRWAEGTPVGIPNQSANQGFHYLLARSVATDFALPTMGTIHYDLLATTRPTIVDGSLMPGGVEADLALVLGTAPRVAFDARFVMPAADGAAQDIRQYSTVGGVANPDQSTTSLSVFSNGSFNFVVPGVPSDTCQSDTCQFSARGLFGGDSDTLGFIYNAANGQGGAKDLTGAMIFGQTDGGATGGGNTGGTPNSNYTGGFSAAAANSVTAYAYSLSQAGFTIPVQARTPRFGGTNFDVTPNQHIIDEDGGLARIQGSNGATVIDRETALNVDIAGDENLLIGRWTDGRFVDGAGGPNGRNTLTANQGFHYFVARGLESPVSIAPGLVTYTLAHATQPTLGSGRSAPGVFNANLAIEYGAAPKLGIDGTIVFEGTSGFTYTFATNGGAAAPSKEIAFSEPSAAGRGGFFNFTSDTGSTDTGLDGTFGATGSLGKADGSDVAIGYTVDLVPRTGFQGETIAGAAIFRSQGGTGGNTGGGNTGTVVANQLIAYAGADVGIDLRERAEVTYNSAGAPVGYVWKLNDFTAENERPTIGTATAMEAGSRGDGLIGWTRWADGQGGGRYFADTDGFTLPANGGFHIVAVDPATDLPTGGQITYELAGSTNPTVRDASLAPGTFTGTMAIAFGAAPTADFNFTVGIGGSSYNFGASGRPIETSGDFANQFGANDTAVSGTGAVCPTGSCQANMRGALGGVGATAVGVSYNFAESGNENLRTYGAAAFVAPGIDASSVGSSKATASIAPSTAPIASIDMSRWSGSGTAGLQAMGVNGGAALAIDLLPPGADASANRHANTAIRSREAVIRQAESIMGGAITFARPGDATRPQ